MTDNPLVEAMARAIRLHRRRDLAFTDDQIAAAALAAIGPGSEAWVRMLDDATDAVVDVDGTGVLHTRTIHAIAEAALRAALGFGE